MELPLGFSPKWIELGIVTGEEIRQTVERFEASDDKSEEHYRWRAFKKFLASTPSLPAEMICALYHLGEQDADFGMGTAMMFDIVGLPGCPSDIIDLAVADTGREALAKSALSRISRRTNG
ncbi:MAG: hypothetical protein H8F28_15575 [Fibrella sp.]|nr:hypothetical protein [Armatimonadota bacterium]